MFARWGDLFDTALCAFVVPGAICMMPLLYSISYRHVKGPDDLNDLNDLYDPYDL